MYYHQSERVQYITASRSPCWGCRWSCTASRGVSLMFRMSRLMSKTREHKVKILMHLQIQCFTQYCIIFDELLTCPSTGSMCCSLQIKSKIESNYVCHIRRVAIWWIVQQYYGLGVRAFWTSPWHSGTACCALAKGTVYDLGDWSLWQFLGLPPTPPGITGCSIHTGLRCPCTGWSEGCTPVGLENKDTFGQ